ncbi:Cupin domain protein [Pseudoxanthomonas sp. GM95]|uniref:cupin domain-containing protein n=1 Tax=Pseudoxanthomonas sp. GM95 TaxID=1881043 RepID=UPI0008BFAE5E|nr:cupin domain-containing protein [Pseudoxanthomonas sp. GM95]SEL11745.1 Cupin domain protein [Pseudoxanthomonas sp. GM95]
MRNSLIAVLLTFCLVLPAFAADTTKAAADQGKFPRVHKLPHATVTELMIQPLADQPGKEIETIVVDFPPGAIDPVHRHDAHAVVYVLEGRIVMGVKGKPEQEIGPGETFYEGPSDIHTVGRNASKDKPAKFVVVLFKDKGKPIVLPP